MIAFKVEGDKEKYIEKTGEQIFCEERVLGYREEFEAFGWTGLVDRCESVVDSSLYYYHKNHLGSVVGISDGNGDVVIEYDYDVYGKAYVKDGDNWVLLDEYDGEDYGNSRLFTAREYDREIGLYYYRARYYDPVLGRFISRDIIGQLDDINLYGYVGNSPLMGVDPLGLYDIGNFGNNLYHYGKGLYNGGEALVEFGYNAVTDPVGTIGDPVIDGYSLGYEFAKENLNNANFFNEMSYAKDEFVDYLEGLSQEELSELGGEAVFMLLVGPKGINSGAKITSRVSRNIKIGAGSNRIITAGYQSMVCELKVYDGVGKNTGKLGDRKVPNPNGKKGGKLHKDKIQEQFKYRRKKGYKVREEVRVKTLGGDKNYRYLDLGLYDITIGKLIKGIQVGKQTKKGKPVSRERKAIDDIENNGGVEVDFIPYNK